MDYQLILDFEMCMVQGSARKKMKGMRNEIIQIGAVMMNEEHHIVDEFSSYVKPEFGMLNKFIKDLTGIGEEQLRHANCLIEVLESFVQWIGSRDVTIISWSDSDYIQLKQEMNAKGIRQRRIETLLSEWVDFQHAFDKMLRMERQISLKEAMLVGRLHPIGKQHDGLADAYNTARLFAKVHRQQIFCLDLQPISSYMTDKDRLCYSIGDMFTPELLAQFHLSPTNEENEKPDEPWSLSRRIYEYLKRFMKCGDETWNRIRFSFEMKKVDIKDYGCSIFRKKFE